MQINPMQLIQMIKQGQNPQQLMLYVLETQASGTPMGENLLNLAREARTKHIEQIAPNLTQQKGLDFDKEFTAFRRQLGV